MAGAAGDRRGIGTTLAQSEGGCQPHVRDGPEQEDLGPHQLGDGLPFQQGACGTAGEEVPVRAALFPGFGPVGNDSLGLGLDHAAQSYQVAAMHRGGTGQALRRSIVEQEVLDGAEAALRGGEALADGRRGYGRITRQHLFDSFGVSGRPVHETDRAPVHDRTEPGRLRAHPRRADIPPRLPRRL